MLPIWYTEDDKHKLFSCWDMSGASISLEGLSDTMDCLGRDGCLMERYLDLLNQLLGDLPWAS